MQLSADAVRRSCQILIRKMRLKLLRSLLVSEKAARNLHAVRISTQAELNLPASSEDRNQSQSIPLSNPAYLVWGANTDVGKTLVCAGIAAAAARSRVRLWMSHPQPIQA